VAIDWSATGDMLAGIGAIAGAAAIVGAAWLGRLAIADYRNQKLADKEIDAAEAVLTAAYREEDALEGMRGRFMPAGELHASEEQLKELGLPLDGMSNSEKMAYVQRGVVYRRAEFFKNDFDAVFQAIPAARAYFGTEIVERLKALPRARNRILHSADFLPMMEKDSLRSDDAAFWRGVRCDVFGIPVDGVDTLSDEVKGAIVRLETKLQGKLKPSKNA
jgi:hypothetical protein